MRPGVLIRAFLILLTASCASDAPPDEGGRWVESSEASFVVDMHRSANSRTYSCTATKIGPRILLTTRPCYALFDGHAFELSHADEANAIAVRVEKSAVPPPEADADLYDVVLLRVDRDLPAFGTGTLLLEPKNLQERSFRGYGYGCDPDRLRELSLQLISEERYDSMDLLIPPVPQSEAPLALFDGPDRLCPGDGGGPIVDSQGRVFALVTGERAALTSAVKADASLSGWLEQRKSDPSDTAWSELQLAR